MDKIQKNEQQILEQRQVRMKQEVQNARNNYIRPRNNMGVLHRRNK